MSKYSGSKYKFADCDHPQMMQQSQSDFESPFGTYALPLLRNWVRGLAAVMPANKLGLLGASGLRRLSLLGSSSGLDGPYDINVTAHIRARLFPRSNRCEKRAYCGVQTWDATERDVLRKALISSGKKSFAFVDVGANVGFYSLFMHHYAKSLDRDISILAIEPDPENRARLSFNTEASGVDLKIEPVAVSGATGEGILAGGDVNRGSIGLQTDTTIAGTKVKLETLSSIINRNGIEEIAAMKVDIEGHDFIALEAFFKQAKKQQYPKLIIVETGQFGDAPIVDLVVANGYRLLKATKMNAMLERHDDE